MSGEGELRFDAARVSAILERLERLAAGDIQVPIAISDRHDELDAIAFGINVLADELRWTHARMSESERTKITALRDELAHLGRVTMLDALTISLAHEINQPLTAVMANAEAALQLLSAESPPLGELRETLHEILEDNKRADDVVRRMRALLKKGTTRFEPVDLNSTVSDAVRLVQGNAVSRRIVVNAEFAADLEPVIGDRVQIHQVVLNLLMNAFDAVQPCEVASRRVRVCTSCEEHAAIVDVADSGPGLTDDEMAQVFQPFFTTKPDGMGLGLSICRTIVDAHGGTIDARRNPDAGMTFSAQFPLWRHHGTLLPIQANTRVT